MRPAAPGRARSRDPRLLGSVLVVLGATLSGVLGPLARLLYEAGMTPFAFVVWRGIIAGAALWLLVLWRRRRPGYRVVIASLPRRERIALVVFAGANIVLNTSLFVAFDRIPIAIALLTFYTYPVLLALYGRVTGTESLSVAKVVALALALGGLSLVVSAQGGPAVDIQLDPLGLALAAVASLSAAVWVGAGRACASVPAEQAMGLSLAWTVAAVGTLAIVAGQDAALRYPLQRIDGLALVVFTGLLSGAGAAVIFTMGMRLISRVRSGILGLVEPIVGVAAAAIILGELLSPVQLLGGALVLGAAVLIQRASDDPAPIESVPEPVVAEPHALRRVPDRSRAE
ncbi:MAG: hypothetical protein FJ038_09685 [Chloroflexi bacterium]|nr:hypothetical protein [Chloroflexota bacterium]